MERVFIGNLPPDIRIKDIDDFFRPFGKLVYVDVNNRTNPASAFVQFDSPRNAFNAVRSRHGYDYEGYTIQMKLMANANNSNDGSFEVRNQRQQQQRTPPPPPPMFNDFNNQNSNNMSGFGNNNGNFGNSGGNFGNNGNFGNSGGNFGGNFGNNGNNFGNYNNNNDRNSNFMNSSSSFQNNMSSQNMIQYPTTSRAIMPMQNKMVEYPNTGRYGGGGSGSNNAIGMSNRSGGGGGSNRAGGSNRPGGGPGNSRPGGGPGNNRPGGGAANNRSAGGANRGNVATNAKTSNKATDRYGDPNFEDGFTLGLSGARRKWFNRYIREGFTPKQARQKAIESRNQPPNQNNSVPNLPVEALETIGNKLISMFGAAGVNNNQMMMSSLSNWGGGFSNDFNMGGPSSSNAMSRNRNRPTRNDGTTGKNILGKMLADIPTSQQQNEFANRKYRLSVGILKKLEDKESVVALNRKEIADKEYHTELIKEYRVWRKNKTIPKDEGKIKDVDDPKATPRYKSALRFVAQFEWRKPSSMTRPEKRRYEKCTELILAYEKKMKSQSRPLDPNHGKTIKQLLSEYKCKKMSLLKEAATKSGEKRSGASKKRMQTLVKEGVDETEARILSMLPKEKLDILVTLNRSYIHRTGENINVKLGKLATKADKDAKDKTAEDQNANARRTRNTYRNALKFLRKYETHELDTLTDREKALLRICLRRKIRIDEEQGTPATTTRFDYLLTENVAEDDEDDNKNSEINAQDTEKPEQGIENDIVEIGSNKGDGDEEVEGSEENKDQTQDDENDIDQTMDETAETENLEESPEDEKDE